MKSGDTRPAELTAALEALKHIAHLVADGRAGFEHSRDRQLALVFCWVNIGSLLKQFVRTRGLPTGTEPLAGPIRMRDKLAYGSITDLRTDIVWDTCVIDGPRLRRVLSDLAAAV